MKKYIIANWKSNKNYQEALTWLNNFPDGDENKARLRDLEIILVPPYPFLSQMKEVIEEKNLPIRLAVQNLSAFGSGSYTGEVAAENLNFLNVDYAVLGHSERRTLLKESSQEIAEKITRAIAADIKPILCLDRPYFKEQAELIKKAELESCFIAYEPLEAIGTGKSFNAADLPKVKKELTEIFSPLEKELKQKFIYGGSVSAANVADYLKFCDGVLIGGASLDLNEFVDLLYIAVKACQS